MIFSTTAGSTAIAWPTSDCDTVWTSLKSEYMVNAATLCDTTAQATVCNDWGSAVRRVKYRNVATNRVNELLAAQYADGWASTATNWSYDYCNDACNIEVTLSNSCIKWADAYQPLQKSPEQRLKEIIASRHAPAIIVNDGRKVLPHTTDIRELRARETLRRVIGEDKFHRLLRDGFVAVKGKDGFHYQIFPGHGITCVYDKGVMTERLCVVMKGDFPATDSIIMRYLMILNNPSQFRSIAIRHNVTQRRKTEMVERPNLSLTEIYQGLKRKAA